MQLGFITHDSYGWCHFKSHSQAHRSYFLRNLQNAKNSSTNGDLHIGPCSVLEKEIMAGFISRGFDEISAIAIRAMGKKDKNWQVECIVPHFIIIYYDGLT